MNNQIQQRLNYLREQIEKECISYGEIAELQCYRDEILNSDDEVLAQWAGISEEDWCHRFTRESNIPY